MSNNKGQIIDYHKKEAMVEEMPDDVFGREFIAQKMSDLICSSKHNDISPIALDGPWGSGKTVHAKRMENYIKLKKQDTHLCVYWNAARNDFTDDPLPMFVAAMYEKLPPIAEIRSEFNKSAEKLCAPFVIGFLKNIGLQLVDKHIGINIREALDEGSRQAEFVFSCDRFLQVINDFLTEAADNVGRIKAAASLIRILAQDKEVVFIIDELDRCRPNFALRMLENIKYLFDVPNCKFILIVNKASIASAAASTYGLDKEEAERYIEKFLKITMQLPTVSAGYIAELNCNLTYYKHLMKDLKCRSFLQNDMLDSLLLAVTKHKKISLREIEKMVGIIRLMANDHDFDLNKINHFYHAALLLAVAALAVTNNRILSLMRTGQADVEQLLQELGCTENYDLGRAFSLLKKYLRDAFKIFLTIGQNKKEEIFSALPEDNSNDFEYIRLLRDADDFLSKWIYYAMLIA